MPKHRIKSIRTAIGINYKNSLITHFFIFLHFQRTNIMNSKFDFQVIKHLRKRSNLTLEKLSKAAGLTYPTVATIENNKSAPSLKTLDALAGALGMSASQLLSLAEKRISVRRNSQPAEKIVREQSNKGMQFCRVADFNAAKIIRVSAEKNATIHSMELHKDVYELVYVLSGVVELDLNGSKHLLEADQSMLFDAALNHSYIQIEQGEFFTVHISKKTEVLAGVLSEPQDASG